MSWVFCWMIMLTTSKSYPWQVVSVTNFFFFSYFWILLDWENPGYILWLELWFMGLLQSRFEPCSCKRIFWMLLEGMAGYLWYISLGRSRVDLRSAPKAGLHVGCTEKQQQFFVVFTSKWHFHFLAKQLGVWRLLSLAWVNHSCVTISTHCSQGHW